MDKIRDVLRFRAWHSWFWLDLGRALLLVAVASGPYLPSHAAPFAYVARWLHDDVAVIDTATNKVVAYVPVGKSPHGVVVAPNGAHAYIGNVNSDTVSVISGATHKVVATIEVGAQPESIAVTPDSAFVYVALYAGQGKNDLAIIDTKTNQVVGHVAATGWASGVAVSHDGAYVYLVCFPEKLFMIETKTHKIVATVKLGKTPQGAVVTPDGKQVYVANWDDHTVTVMNTSTHQAATIKVGNFPWMPAVSPDGKVVYVGNALDSTMSIIDTATNKVVKTFPVGKKPISVAFTPNGKFAYVVNQDAETVEAVDTASHKVVATIPVPGYNGAFGRFIIPGKPSVVSTFAFAAPLQGLPRVNVAAAGEAIDVRFSLGEDLGLDVVAPGYPRSEQIPCVSAIPLNAHDLPASRAPSNTLAYDTASKVYSYVWLTESTWSRTCRHFTMEMVDGSRHEAVFQFR
ncbi:PxKF domain-containing protein [Variovorax sp. JS1663]|uniref:PxKF domain-containing protein n=1 Tax=Variovorax sp. JS1663 TaxID=1851577 RepID=UPI00117D29D2|nr:PxKF domain-containing protein [Variovorax sp. JS1663]